MNIVSGSRCRTASETGSRPPIRITQVPRCLYPVGIAVYRIPVEKIESNPAGTRQIYSSESITALAESIRHYGVIHPLTVRQQQDGLYELVSGERRLRAVRLLGLSQVNCIVINADRRQSDAMSLCENMQQERLHFLDEAEAIGALCDRYGLSAEQAAEKICCSCRYVKKMLELLAFSEEERTLMRSSSLTEAHARALLRVPDPAVRRSLLGRAVSEQLDAAATGELVLLALKKISGKRKQHGIFLFRDVRIFYNTVDHAVDTMRRAGFDIRAERSDTEDGTVITIVIPKKE